ncbi:MAG: HPr family phosphocarrier protein [Planctomycetota bacterium]|jgi:phosphotransferase system HPr (HPr) family protein
MLTGENTLEEEIYETEIEIRNSDGLHMRPAMQFVDLANQFNCDITVSNQQDSADAKSIMQMTILAATCGTKLKIVAKGADAQQAIQALKELVEKRLFNNPATEQEKKG